MQPNRAMTKAATKRIQMAAEIKVNEIKAAIDYIDQLIGRPPILQVSIERCLTGLADLSRRFNVDLKQAGTLPQIRYTFLNRLDDAETELKVIEQMTQEATGGGKS